MTEVRLANIADAALIALLGRVTFSDTFGHLFLPEALQSYLEQTFGFERTQQSLQNPENVFWLAKVDGTPAGYAKLKLLSHAHGLPARKSVQLEKIYVYRDFLSKKVGNALLEAVEDRCRQENADALWLMVHDENARAIRFYLQHGFFKHESFKLEIEGQIFEYDVMVKPI